MKEEGQLWWVRTLCMIWFVFELAGISYTGIRELFPIYVYGSYEEDTVWEEMIRDQIHVFLPVYETVKEQIIVDTRKDMFAIKKMDQSQMLTMMELENSDLGQEQIWEFSAIRKRAD